MGGYEAGKEVEREEKRQKGGVGKRGRGYFMLVTTLVFHEPMFTQSALEKAGLCFMQA